VTWSVREVTARRTTLDFTSSGQGRYDATQILLDGEIFSNAAGLTSWKDPCIQVLVCESCGIEHCEPGGWVALRSAGPLRLFIPTFSEWDSAENRMEYAPPRVVAERGAPVFEPPLYAALRERIPELPEVAQWLSGDEASRLLEFEAPAGLTLTVGAAELSRRLVAAGDTEVDRAVEALFVAQGELRQWESVAARPLSQQDEVVTFCVNDASFTEWRPMVLSSDGPRLSWGRWVLERWREAG
jgi:hypothetical protein